MRGGVRRVRRYWKEEGCTAEVDTPHGRVRVKVAGLDGTPIGAEPEFDDCRRRAEEAGVPVRRVWATALAPATSLVTTLAAGSAPERGPRGRKRKQGGG